MANRVIFSVFALIIFAKVSAQDVIGSTTLKDKEVNGVKVYPCVRNINDDRESIIWDILEYHTKTGTMEFRVLGEKSVQFKRVEHKMHDGTSYIINGQRYDPDKSNNYSVIVPEYIEYQSTIYKVVSIGEKAFTSDYLTSVRLPKTLKKIASLAFYNCKRLEQLEVPSTITSIGMLAFKNCKSLSKVTLPNTLIELGNGVFEGCINLKTVILSENLTTIPKGTFYGCKELEIIKIPYKVKSISSDAFRGCTSLTKVLIPSSLEQNLDYIFKDCPKIILEEYGKENIVQKEKKEITTEEKKIIRTEKYNQNIFKDLTTNIPREIELFIRTFYQDYIFDNKNFNEKAKTLCTKDLLYNLRSAYKGKCNNDICYALSLFRNGYDEGVDKNALIRSIYLFNKTTSSEWYIVYYIYKDQELATGIEFVRDNGRLLLNGVGPIQIK